MLRASATWTNGKQFIGESGSGHGFVMDTSPDTDGRNTGPSPMELLLAALAGCTGIDVVLILKEKMHKPLTGLTVAVTGERAEVSPRIFTSIEVCYKVQGPSLPLKDVVRAIQLSAEKYCSVAAMLGKVATIRSRYELLDETTGATVSGEIGATS